MFSIKNLSFNIRHLEIIKNVDLDYPSSTGIISFIGTNGSGKSSLFKCILGIYENNSIFFNNKPISQTTQENGIGFFSEENGVYPYMTVGEFLNLFIIKIYNKDFDFLKNIIEKWNLLDIQNIQIKKLSKGNSKKISLCRTLSNEFPIYLLDEPFEFLDDNNIAFLLNEIKEKSEHALVIINTHRLDLIKNISNKIYKIENLSLKEIL